MGTDFRPSRRTPGAVPTPSSGRPVCSTGLKPSVCRRSRAVPGGPGISPRSQRWPRRPDATAHSRAPPRPEASGGRSLRGGWDSLTAAYQSLRRTVQPLSRFCRRRDKDADLGTIGGQQKPCPRRTLTHRWSAANARFRFPKFPKFLGGLARGLDPSVLWACFPPTARDSPLEQTTPGGGAALPPPGRTAGVSPAAGCPLEAAPTSIPSCGTTSFLPSRYSWAAHRPSRLTGDPRLGQDSRFLFPTSPRHLPRKDVDVVAIRTVKHADWQAPVRWWTESSVAPAAHHPQTQVGSEVAVATASGTARWKAGSWLPGGGESPPTGTRAERF